METQVLVVGAVLLDMIGTSSGENSSPSNKIGNVRISLGGAAFNVAANLSEKGFKTSLFTCFRKGSTTTQLIRTGLAESGIDVRYALEVDTSIEPAFVALFDGTEFVTGVTSSPIERADILHNGELEKGVKECLFVAIDTNLSISQIQGVVALAKKYGKPIAAAIVSDAKVQRIASVPIGNFQKKFEFVCLNSVESTALGVSVDMLKDANKSRECALTICAKLNTEVVILSDERKGHYVIRGSGSVKHFDAPEVHVVSSLGAGDALFSAACAAWITQKDVDSPASSMLISDWVSAVLGTDRSNINSAQFDKPSIKVRRWPLYAIILICVSVLLTLLGTFAPDLTPLQFGFCLVGACLTAGPAGALVRSAIKGGRYGRVETDGELIAVGALAGVVAGFVAALPHFSVAIVKHHLSEDISDLRLVPVLGFLFAVAAGTAFEIVLSNVKHNVEQLGE